MDTNSNTINYENGVRLIDSDSAKLDRAIDSKLAALISDAVKIGCVNALKANDHNVDYLLDPRRCKYLDVAEIRDTDDVLEIGSSMGQHTRLIAKQCMTLQALEVVPQQAQFARIWCDEDGLNNVEFTASGASGTLPYPDESFDLVICNYVLEWCAGRSSVDPAQFHKAFLQEIYRVLRKGGRLFVSTKNRYSFRYVTGSHDEHLGVRFGSALPRMFHKWLRARAKLGHPPGYLHSWHSLGNLLDESGFAHRRSFLAFPDNRYADYVGTFDNFSIKQLSDEAVSALSRKNAITLHFSNEMLKFFSNSILYLAAK